MTKSQITKCIILLTILLSFFLGLVIEQSLSDRICISVGTSEYPTFSTAANAANKPIFSPTELKNNVEELLSVHTHDEVAHLRLSLLKAIFGTEKFPDEVPDLTEVGTSNEWSDLKNVAKIEKAVFHMDNGIDSIVHIFHANNPKKTLVIYHEGHREEGYILAKREIQVLLNAGYSVLAFAMPLYGNPQPEIFLEKFGRFKLVYHDQLKYLDRPFHYFFEPISRGIEWAVSTGKYDKVAMIGLSGGGWTTTVFAAINPRINLSISVAGSYPTFLRTDSFDSWGDFEQNDPRLYSIANYLDLYVMAAMESDRKELQIFNSNDPIAFPGEKSGIYKKVIQDRLHRIQGGKFDVFIDKSNLEHSISDTALKIILEALEEG